MKLVGLCSVASCCGIQTKGDRRNNNKSSAVLAAMNHCRRLHVLVICCALAIFAVPAVSFLPPNSPKNMIRFKRAGTQYGLAPPVGKEEGKLLLLLKASSHEDDNSVPLGISKSDQTVIGGAGTVAAIITLYSEFVLKTTGCGLPAGPLGLVGLTEGFSYLSVVGIGAFSLYRKVKTGNGLPAGPGGLLGAAEGFSFLAIVAGLVVLVLQITNYGYVPNAVPMEGGMCH